VFAVSETRKTGSEVISGLLSLGSTNPFPAQGHGVVGDSVAAAKNRVHNRIAGLDVRTRANV